MSNTKAVDGTPVLPKQKLYDYFYKHMDWEGWQVIANLTGVVIRSRQDRGDEVGYLVRDWVPAGYIVVNITHYKWCEYRQDVLYMSKNLLVKNNAPHTILQAVEEWCKNQETYLQSMQATSCVGPRYTPQNPETLAEVIEYINNNM